jgi:hypothetical protein
MSVRFRLPVSGRWQLANSELNSRPFNDTTTKSRAKQFSEVSVLSTFSRLVCPMIRLKSLQFPFPDNFSISVLFLYRPTSVSGRGLREQLAVHFIWKI